MVKPRRRSAASIAVIHDESYGEKYGHSSLSVESDVAVACKSRTSYQVILDSSVARKIK
jgi:hypothetical protein